MNNILILYVLGANIFLYGYFIYLLYKDGFIVSLERELGILIALAWPISVMCILLLGWSKAVSFCAEKSVELDFDIRRMISKR
jgi:hypothetical protein